VKSFDSPPEPTGRPPPDQANKHTLSKRVSASISHTFQEFSEGKAPGTKKEIAGTGEIAFGGENAQKS